MVYTARISLSLLATGLLPMACLYCASAGENKAVERLCFDKSPAQTPKTQPKPQSAKIIKKN